VTDRMPVLDKALKLQSEVRRLEAGAEGDEQANRIARRVGEIEAELALLSGHARAARTLLRHTTDVISIAGLEAGRDDLTRRASGAIPSDSAFVAARQKVQKTASRLAAEVQSAWKAWADDQLTFLPVRRIAMLDSARQASAQARLKGLRNLAGAAGVTASDISEFTAAYAGLKEELEEAKDVPEALLGLIDRLSPGPVTLRDVSDDEIALLRKLGLDREIELRRKGG
jgi:hypothetical protein